ncbi:metal ABC transporter solute-binding protein, Zn/Mn family [Neobacillus dielmonensis]|uniref:metal ABC transporter solute-binding protein, Zn/Mn family n=1 Tax=Neobacillus dielmonensis TaxID=1347369 RepID=UPI0005AA4B71|nr:zinc ABC transporter substrate-binding protein [Neobacillus dielmonensis]
MKKLIYLLAFFLPISFVLSACANDEGTTTKEKDKLIVYTTVYPLQYFTERIGGKYVNVKTIYPPGADEHTFEPSQKDMMKLADADLFFYVGLGLEGFVESAKDTLKNQNVIMTPVANQLKLPKNSSKTVNDHDEGENNHDVNPHVWLDPVYSKEMAAVIRDSLNKKMPGHKEYFNEQYQKLAGELDELDNQFQTTISQAKHKKIIVTHAAFGYWEQRYGLEQISISGLSTANEPTQKELKAIIATADQEGIHYILFEQNVQSRLGEIIQKEIGARSLPIHNLGILTQKEIDQKETYFSLMKHNLETLDQALNH